MPGAFRMEHEFNDLSRGGTAPIQPSAISSKAKGSGQASSPSRFVGASSPIRSKPLSLHRPKTSSTADIADINYSFRANRTFNSQQQQQQSLRGLSSELVGIVDGGLSREDERDKGIPFAAAAKSAWGSSSGVRLARGASEKDLSNRQPKKSGTSVYMQAASPVLTSQRSSGRSSNNYNSIHSVGVDDVSRRDAITAAQARSRLTTPNSLRPRNSPAASSSQQQAIELKYQEQLQQQHQQQKQLQQLQQLQQQQEQEQEQEQSDEAGSHARIKKTSLYGSGNLSYHMKKNPTHGISPGAVGSTVGASSSGSGKFSSLEQQVPLGQSAAAAYLGDAPPVLRSSSTRSRTRLHVNVTGSSGTRSLYPPAMEEMVAGIVPVRPQTHQNDSHARPSTQMLRVTSSSKRNQLLSSEDTVDVVEEISELPEEEGAAMQQFEPQETSLSVIVPTFPLPSSAPRTITKQLPSPTSPSFRSDLQAPSATVPTGSSPQPQPVLREDVIYICHHDMESTRKLERPTSRKPYLGSATKNEESSTALLDAPRATSARLAAVSAPIVAADEGSGGPFKLKRASSFNSTPPRDTSKQDRPPSRQISAFPINLSSSASEVVIEDWDLLIAEKLKKEEASVTRAADHKASKTKIRQKGQPVDLDELDSDDEIFQQRDRRRASVRYPTQSHSNNSAVATTSSNVDGAAPVSVSAISSGVHPSSIVVPLQFGTASLTSQPGSTTSARHDPGSARRGSQSARRGSDPVSDGFSALGFHDEQSWPFSIQVNYEKVEALASAHLRKQHTPRHISEMENKLQAMHLKSTSSDNQEDDLSEFDLDADGIAVLTSQTPRSIGSKSNTRKSGSSPTTSAPRTGGWGAVVASSSDSGKHGDEKRRGSVSSRPRMVRLGD